MKYRKLLKQNLSTLLITSLVTFLIKIYFSFDLFWEKISSGEWVEPLFVLFKDTYFSLFVGGSIGVVYLVLKNVLSDHSEVIKNIDSAKDELLNVKIELQEANKTFIQNLKGLYNEITNNQEKSLTRFFSNLPFEFFRKEINHTGVIGTLLMKSIDGMKTSLKVKDRNEYMNIINEAVSFTKRFCGVNRKSIYSFYEPLSESFHETFHLRLKKINPKERIFILDDIKKNKEGNTEYDIFIAELNSDKCFPRFHIETFGINTFYSKLSEVKSCVGIPPDIDINDFGIYDDLIIKFDNNNEINYNIISNENTEIKIYKVLFEQIKNHNFSVFKPLLLYVKNENKQYSLLFCDNLIKQQYETVKQEIQNGTDTNYKYDISKEDWEKLEVYINGNLYSDTGLLIKKNQLWKDFKNEIALHEKNIMSDIMKHKNK